MGQARGNEAKTKEIDGLLKKQQTGNNKRTTKIRTVGVRWVTGGGVGVGLR